MSGILKMGGWGSGINVSSVRGCFLAEQEKRAVKKGQRELKRS